MFRKPVAISYAGAMLVSLLPAIVTGQSQSEPSRGDQQALEEVVVVGSRIRSAASDTSSQPVQYVTRDQFDLTSGTSIEQYLQSMPVNTGLSKTPETDEYNGGNQTMNLRGIGDRYTLTLVDGRRFGGEDVPDLGAIPSIAVDGVEVLKSGASSVYGSDAVAGVVNIRLREDFQGLQFDALYGNTTQSDGSVTHVGILAGHVGPRGSFTGSFSYLDQNAILKTERDRTRTRDLRRFGGQDRRSTFFGVPHQIFVGDESMSIDVTSLGPGSSSLDLSDFVPYNHELQAVSTAEHGVRPENTRYSGHWAGRFNLSDDVSVFSRGYIDNRKQYFVINHPYAVVTAPASNPHNPFGEDVGVVYTFGPNEIDFMQMDFDILNTQGTFGLESGENSRFNWEIAHTIYRKSARQVYMNDIDLSLAQEAVERTDPATAFNPFCYWCNTQDQIGGITYGVSAIETNHVNVTDAFLSGTLFSWAAGDVEFAVGGEYRSVTFDYEPDRKWQEGPFFWFPSRGVPTSDERNVTASFGELRLPLYDDDQNVVNSVDASMAIRREKYSDFGSSTVGQASGRIAFAQDRVILRASWSEGFRAPSLRELNRPVTTRTFPPGGAIFDPVRGTNEAFDLIEGGNVDLDPESSESVNVGLIFQPNTARDIHIAVDYWQIEIDGLIVEPGIQSLFDGTTTAGSITRDPGTLYPTLDLRLDNGGRREVEGIDLGVNLGWDTTDRGRFDVNFSATKMTKFEDTAGDGQVVDRLGKYNTFQFGPLPELRANVHGSWSSGNWRIGSIIYWVGSYDDIVPGFVEREVESYTKVDFKVTYDFGQTEDNWLFNGTTAYIGVENIFDADLPFVAGNSNGWDVTMSDYRGRYIYGGFSKKLF